MADLVTFGETMLRLSPPRGDRLETTDGLDLAIGGAESNVAVAASCLGTDAAWLSKLPDSPLGRRVVRELRGHGVRTGVTWTDDADLRVGTYYLERGETPRGTEVIYDRANAAVTTVTPDELAVGAVRNAEVFFTSGITPALSATLAETTASLAKAAAAADTTVAFDLNYRSKLWSREAARESYRALLPRVDLLVAAERDARDVLGREGDALEVAHGLATDFDVGTVVVTRGERGALCLHGGEAFEQDAYEAETIDPIGTGDAFVGGFLAERLRGGDVEAALAVAAATAALKRTVEGDVAVVTPAEVETVVAEGGAEISR